MCKTLSSKKERKIRRVYCAGPLTLPEPGENINITVAVAERCVKAGWEPYVPHLNHLWHLIHPHDWEYWMARDLAWLPLCDVLVRIPGASRGADLEVAEAKRLGIRVIEGITIESLMEFL